MPVFRVSRHLDTSQRFLEDSVLKADEDVVIRSADILHGDEIGGNLYLTVIHHIESTMTYKAANSSTTVHKLTVMDGSHGVFKAQLNSSLSRSIRSWNIPVGSTLTVKRYDWIWCDNQSLLDCKAITRGIMLIHDFAWRPAPCADPCILDLSSDATLVLGDDVVNENFSWDVVDYTQETSFVGWLQCVLNENDERVMVLMSDDQLRAGKFINHVKTKADFLAGMTGKDEYDYLTDYSNDDDDDSDDRSLCNCRTRFGIGVCVCIQFPIETIHKSRGEVFEDAVTRFDDNERISNTFDELPPSKKRWCMYWWYSINIFQVRGYCNRKRLPDCFVDMIRKQYPNKKGDFFTGYKRSEKQQVEQSKKRIKHLEELTNLL